MEPTPPAPPSGPPDEESQRALERIECMLKRGMGALIVRNCLVALFAIAVLFAIGANPKHPAIILLTLTLLISAHRFAKIEWKVLTEHANRIQSGESFSASAELRDTPILLAIQFAQAFVGPLGIHLLPVGQRPEAIIVAAVAMLVFGVWTIRNALNAMEKTPPSHMRRSEAWSHLVLAFLMLCFGVTALYVFHA